MRRLRHTELAVRRRTVFGHCHLTVSNSPSRSRGACLRPGFAISLHSPRTRVGGAPRVVRVLGGTPVRRAHNAARQALARRLASHDAANSRFADGDGHDADSARSLHAGEVLTDGAKL